jgi:outer membrane immunogenic protein
MKKLIITCAFAIVCSVAFAQIKIGAHAGYGFDAEKIAFGANAEIFVMEKLSIAPNAYFWGKDEAAGLTAKAWEASVDGHYYFVNTDIAGVYGLVGLNIAFASLKGDFLGVPLDESDSKIGANIGAGASFLNSGKVSPFAEIKYETPFEQLVIGAGIRFTLIGK